MTKRVQTKPGARTSLSNALFVRIGDQLLLETRLPLWSPMSDDNVYRLRQYLLGAIKRV